MVSQLVAVLLTATMLLGCASRTLIRSHPSGATVYVNGVAVGRTPYAMEDRKIVGSDTKVRLEQPGYETLDTTIKRNENLDGLALVAGIFFLVPLLWVMEYDPDHFYSLKPAVSRPGTPSGQPPVISAPPPVAPSGPSASDVMAKARRANELNSEGRELLQSGKYEAAVAKFEHAVELLKDPRFYFNLCVAHESAGNRDRAIASCNEVKKNEPSKRLLGKTNEMLKTLRKK